MVKTLEVIYRIYEVADEETAKHNRESDIGFGFYSSTSKSENTELLMDCLMCDDRNQFKEIIKSMYGESIAFRYSKKLNPGDLYCIIIGEHCYNGNKYFDKIKFTCDQCGATVETYYSSPICFSPYEIRHELFNLQEYETKRFCCEKCKSDFKQIEIAKLRPNDDREFWISRDMFTKEISGYIYKITKKSTGEFYVGQTMYAPVFRWGQHLKTERFPISGITDYKFEVLEIVPKSENILEREKFYIQKCYMDNPSKSLNIAGIADCKKAGGFDN